MPALPDIISPRELEQILDNPPENLLIIDLCQPEQNPVRTIPGAVHINRERLVYGNKPVTGLLPPPAQLQTLFREIGLKKESRVVVYDDANSTWAARMIWTLDILGHEKATLVDGGFAEWLAAKLPVENQYAQPAPSKINISIDLGLIAEKNAILDALNHNQLTIWDARSLDEYTGTKSMAKRGGHIPGATHYEWSRLLDERGRIRDLDVIRKELEEIGLTRNLEVITHCQTHRRSALTWFVGKKLLQFNNIRAYPGAWSEWGNADDTPVAS